MAFGQVSLLYIYKLFMFMYFTCFTKFTNHEKHKKRVTSKVKIDFLYCKKLVIFHSNKTHSCTYTSIKNFRQHIKQRVKKRLKNHRCIYTYINVATQKYFNIKQKSYNIYSKSVNIKFVKRFLLLNITCNYCTIFMLLSNIDLKT